MDVPCDTPWADGIRRSEAVQKGYSDSLFKNPIILLCIWAALVYGTFAVIGKLCDPGDYIHEFFFNRGPIQYISTGLFWCAVLILVANCIVLRREQNAVRRLSDPGQPIKPGQMPEAIQHIIPVKDRNSRVGLATLQVCEGYARGEDVNSLISESTSSCRESFERAYAFLSVLKRVLPILGFLGTVIGLSVGMVAFANISGMGQNVEELKKLLQEFAVSLSSAFDTTLLALGYTVILTIVSALVKTREESSLQLWESFLQNRLRRCLSKPANPAEEWSAVIHDLADDIGAKLETTLGRATIQSLSIFERNMNNGISGIIQEWSAKCLSTLSNATENAFGRIYSENNRWSSLVTKTVEETAGVITDRLEKVELAALKRPRIEIRTYENDRSDGNAVTEGQ